MGADLKTVREAEERAKYGFLRLGRSGLPRSSANDADMDPAAAAALADLYEAATEDELVKADQHINDMKNSGEWEQRRYDRAFQEQVRFEGVPKW